MRSASLILFLFLFSWLDAQEISAIQQQCIVQLTNGNIDDLLAAHSHLVWKETLSKNMRIYLLEKKEGAFSGDELNRIGNNPNVKAIQFNHIIENRSLVPNDSFFAQQWNMLNTGQLNGKPGVDINATAAWAVNTSSLSKNGDTLVVAVIDEYFDLYHNDLNFFINHNEIPNNSIDDDGNGFIDDYQGWNAYNNTGNVYGNGGVNHSTLISGIVGAKGNNAKGVAGVVWGVKVLPVGASSTNEAIVIKGYDYVIEMRKLYNQTNGAKGAFIVAGNSSFGVNNGQPQNFPIWCALYDTMGQLGILNATATTNSNQDIDAVGDIPTTCPSKWMIAVTGVTASDNRTGGFGKQNIDIAAPGASVLSTAVNNNYTSSTGTSFACPHIAGAIAAMYAEACPALMNDYATFPDSVALLMKNWLLSSATKTESLNNRTTTDGRLDLYAAILNTHNYNCNNCSSTLLINAADLVCKNDSNGLAILTLQNTASASFLWNDGNTNATRSSLTKGLYQITATDAASCTHTATIIIREPDTLRINSINVVVPTGGNNGNIIVNAYGGGDSLWYSLDGALWQQSNIFSISNQSTFTVYVKNETGCVLQQQVVVSGLNDVGVAIMDVALFPNPASTVLHIAFNANTTQTTLLEVYDISGRRIATKSLELKIGFQVIEYSVDDLANGYYLLRIGNEMVKPFVISR